MIQPANSVRYFKNILFGSLLVMVGFLYYWGTKNDSYFSDAEGQFHFSSASESSEAKTLNIAVRDTTHLQDLCQHYGYDTSFLTQQEKKIPRLYFQNIPQDIRKIKDLELKKQIFLQVLLPMVLQVNEDILKDRKLLLILQDKMEKEEKITLTEETWLQDLAQRYKMTHIDMKELLKRVDIIPPSLALGQSIIETGWGQSYAAVAKNSIFGVTINDKVKFYENLLESTYYYVRNLNTNHAYRQMRETRANLRRQNKELDSYALIKTLLSYSTQRHLYITKVQSAIKKNNLKNFDSLQLKKPLPFIGLI